MAKVLIGSVFASGDKSQRELLDLQLSFIKGTTVDFRHVVVLNSAHGSVEIGRMTEVICVRAQRGNAGHLEGLKVLLEFFRKEEEYSHFLFLDSDAFPIRIGWLDQLIKSMGNKNIAIPIRYENLEQRLHASILFSSRAGLDDLDFVICNEGETLLGTKQNDIRVCRYPKEILDKVLPLIRSNRHNYHPIWAGIYFDMFYHHQGGTWKSTNDHGTFGEIHYWNAVMSSSISHSELTERLMNNPAEYIKGLAGWSPGKYLQGMQNKYCMWGYDGLDFRKAGRGDMMDLLSLQSESWEGHHNACFLNDHDQFKWLDKMSSQNPRDLVMMVLKGEEAIGAFKIFNVDWVSKRADIGWDIYARFRGEGIGKRMVIGGVEFCRHVMGLRHLTAEVIKGNEASVKCAEAAEMRHIGTRSGYVLRGGEYRDSIIFELVNSDSISRIEDEINET